MRNRSDLRGRGQQRAGVLRVQVQAGVFARGPVRIMMQLRKGVLRLDGVDKGESEKVAAAGESVHAALERLFADAWIGVRRKQVSLADDVQRTGRGLHRAERDAREDLLVQIVLPVCNFRLKPIEEALFEYWYERAA